LYCFPGWFSMFHLTQVILLNEGIT
jgi:hypothetical protein